eukprot:6189998-Pleurochrysis_carterae.AAC.2
MRGERAHGWKVGQSSEKESGKGRGQGSGVRSRKDSTWQGGQRLEEPFGSSSRCVRVEARIIAGGEKVSSTSRN